MKFLRLFFKNSGFFRLMECRSRCGCSPAAQALAMALQARLHERQPGTCSGQWRDHGIWEPELGMGNRDFGLICITHLFQQGWLRASAYADGGTHQHHAERAVQRVLAQWTVIHARQRHQRRIHRLGAERGCGRLEGRLWSGGKDRHPI